ncbi:DUF2190 family protein [Mangrovicoccus ximenensis]|uniref:DUF2190 family protein n=1 Tax=Mangrovicoccus ximenensis TaxID=1911570 RepID=UPI000D361000|nr:DUF2190 family protein [Mangrovicoccus ximenensis]
MRNYIQPGDSLTIPAPSTITAGAPVIAGSIVGIAHGDAAAGASVDVAMTGVFELAKVAADDVTLGAPVYWDAAQELATITDTGNTLMGVAVEASATAAATVRVRLAG